MESNKELYSKILMDNLKDKSNIREINTKYKKLAINYNCGDEITVYIKIDNDTIVDISYTGEGCAISKSSTNILCKSIKDMKLFEALEFINTFLNYMIKGEDHNNTLGEAISLEGSKYMPSRIKCATLSWNNTKSILEELV